MADKFATGEQWQHQSSKEVVMILLLDEDRVTYLTQYSIRNWKYVEDFVQEYSHVKHMKGAYK